MVRGLVKPDYSTLPDEVWLKILVHLDARSLLAMEVCSLRFRDIVYDSVVSRKIRCSPNVGIRTIQAFFTSKRVPFIKHLLLDNCFMTDPHYIMHCASICTNLTYFSCIGCQVNPVAILRLITTPQSSLQRIEWSLCGPNVYADVLRRFRNIIVHEQEVFAVSLRYMYVEVSKVDPDGEILYYILARSSALEDVHIHITDGDHYGSIDLCGSLVEDLVKKFTFTYSQEEITSRHIRCPYTRFVGNIHPNIQFKIAASLLGNAVINTRTNGGLNCMFLSDVAQEPAATWSFEQLVLAIKEATSSSAEQLAFASRQRCWSVLRSLTLTLVPPVRHCRLPVFDDNFINPLRSLLASCRAVTELNLTSFHFSTDVKCCKILAANLPMLQALALAPCGINYERSVDKLAIGCLRLEELDVRVSRDGASGFCKACELPLHISEGSMASLQQRSQLKRLSLCDIQHIASLDFLRACRLIELRIFSISWSEDKSYRGIGALLCANPNLRSFTYENNRLHFHCGEFRREMLRAEHLRILSLYSEQHTDVSVIRELIEELTSNMPCLEALHLHYTAVNGTEVPLSWLVNERGLGANTRGVTVAGKPCVFCDRSTYIGLARALNRSDARF
ncbi:hypothetical protein HPB49_006326 [Dermacentor silvarum]|uniref:Uncharacterized protein n=1 Tax=Dermacentor silvarum TaxID=543639 RepID=A0ACB8DVW9_DERSI|nr:hypothetical protein HPB49_006326 [Dermacentor silvarum]